ncbi:hypothetical protein GBAR_LOCUS12652 [Geodia barretti]|uniref:Uncharacterized protein n=1 Tax=Geodia barretti TaxID=519541 RepID=A0AA35S397_GEOBA|nr:hypothetical protein GBAR_LOCUS12652 [Geodia barretti]
MFGVVLGEVDLFTLPFRLVIDTCVYVYVFARHKCALHFPAIVQVFRNGWLVCPSPHLLSKSTKV